MSRSYLRAKILSTLREAQYTEDLLLLVDDLEMEFAPLRGESRFVGAKLVLAVLIVLGIQFALGSFLWYAGLTTGLDATKNSRQLTLESSAPVSASPQAP
jgi:hypothetical protein